MRITPGMIGSQVTLTLQRALAALARQQDHLATGRRVLAPADDPGGTARALVVRARQAAVEQFRRNLASARSSLLAADTGLQAVVEIATRAQEAAVQGASDVNDAVARRAIGTQVDQLLEALVSQANTRDGAGTFLFGGQESTSAPYAATRDAAGRITAVIPNPRGITGETPAEVSEDLTVSTTVSGAEAFGASADATYAFDVLIRLRDALEADQGAAVGAALDELEAVLDRVTVTAATVGTRVGWLALVEERLLADEESLATALSRIEDLDMPEAIAQLQRMQHAYEAALASGARLLQQSLLDHLR